MIRKRLVQSEFVHVTRMRLSARAEESRLQWRVGLVNGECTLHKTKVKDIPDLSFHKGLRTALRCKIPISTPYSYNFVWN